MKIISWNIGEYDGKLGTVLKQENIEKKLKVLKDLLSQENPDIICIVEGTICVGNTQLQELFHSNNYFVYYDPEFVKDKKYAKLFEFENFETYGLKIFIRNDFKVKIKPFDPSRAIHKGRLVNVELIDQKGVFIFLHRNMSRPYKEQHEFISAIYDWCYKGNLGAIAKNLFILGDFNLTPWSKEYFTTESGYLISEFVESVYKIKSRIGACFFNPIINHMSNINKNNLGGTFYSNNYGWRIFDFVLIRDFDKKAQQFEIITETTNFNILDTSDKTRIKSFIDYDFDHLPIKLTVEL